MVYFLYDPSKTVMQPKFWIARPNKQIVTRISELDEIAKLRVELGGINELNGEVPFYLNRNGKTIKNPHIKYIKNKYLIKMEFMNNIEWFVIENVKKNDSGDKETMGFTAYSSVYNLRGKKLYNDTFEGVTPREAFDELLKRTSWATGKISTQIGGKIRSFDEFSPNTTILDAISTMCESYGCIPVYDTNKHLINFLHKDDLSIVSNLMLNDKNYIESYSKDSDSNEIVTRLSATGDEGLVFNSVTPTGKSYIEKFDYFMHPFKRDNNKKVLSRSDYMSDELCHAILDQQEAITNMADIAKNLNKQLSDLIDGASKFENTVNETKQKYDMIQGILDSMKANEEYKFSAFNDGNYTFNFRKGYYIGQLRGTGTISFGSDKKTATSDWTTFKFDKSNLDALGYGEPCTVTSTGVNEFYLVRVPKSEYEDYTELQVKEKYNETYWKEKLELAKAQYNNRETEIESIHKQLDDLYESVSDDQFYTFELLNEKAEFIYDYHYEEPSHTDPQELYDDSVEKLIELHKPKLTIETTIFNFLASLEDKRNWRKLILGSRILVKHSRLDEFNEIILIGIEYDFESESINVTLSDIKELGADEYTSMIIQGANASHTLNLNKHLYDDAVKQSKTFDEILNSEMDATKRRILAGVNESVTFDGRGLRIINPDYPEQMLIGTAGVLALSKTGGRNFEVAITPDGIYGEKVIGRLFIGEKLLIRDDDGTMTLKGSLQTIKDRNGKVKVELGEYKPNKFGLRIPDGAVEIYTNSEPNRGVVLDGQGVRGYNDTGMNTFDLDTNGFLKLYGGMIDLRTSFGANQGVILDGYGLHGFNTSREKTFDLNTEGFLKLYGGYIDIRTAFGSNQGVVFDKDGIRAYNSKNEVTVNIDANRGNITIKGDLTGSNGEFNGTLRSNSLDVNGNIESFTLIDGGKFQSNGTYNRSWGTETGKQEINIFMQNGGMRFRNETLDRSLFYSDYGISTASDGTGTDTSSGTVEFFSKSYGESNGLTLFSSGRIGLQAKGRIYINPGASLRIASRDGNDNTETFKDVYMGNTFVKGKLKVTDMIYLGEDENVAYFKPDKLQIPKLQATDTLFVGTGTSGTSISNTKISTSTLSVNNVDVGAKLESLTEAIQELRSGVSKAQSSADSAQSSANSAYSLASSAYSLASSAYSLASSK